MLDRETASNRIYSIGKKKPSIDDTVLCHRCFEHEESIDSGLGRGSIKGTTRVLEFCGSFEKHDTCETLRYVHVLLCGYPNVTSSLV